MPKRKSIKFDQLSEDVRQLYDVINKFDKESDFACVIVGTAFLDNTLQSLLHSKLLRSEITEKLLDTNKGALGGFQSRADLIYCLSLISKDQYQDLCRIAEIRNLFAHSHLFLSFDEINIQQLCSQLSQWKFLSNKGNTLPTDPTTEDIRMMAKNQFDFTVVILANRLILTGLGLQHNSSRNNSSSTQ